MNFENKVISKEQLNLHFILILAEDVEINNTICEIHRIASTAVIVSPWVRK
jgi:hypothetical protein